MKFIPKNRSAIQPGTRYGRLTVLQTGSLSARTAALCKCDCGAEKAIRLDSLKSGMTTSCGCAFIEAHRTHGLTKHPRYDT